VDVRVRFFFLDAMVLTMNIARALEDNIQMDANVLIGSDR
jgi:hypothetical protein